MIFDISQELFSAEVYPGDPIPAKKEILSMNKNNPDKCNLTEIILGSHTGTHLDAPCHFIIDGKDAEQIVLGKCMGRCLVTALDEISKEDTDQWKAQNIYRILLKNRKKLNISEAKRLVDIGCVCVGVECSTVGEELYNEKVHQILLSNEIVVIEGLRMEHVPEGEYFLSALPLRMREVDGSPVRAILWQKDM